MTGRKGLTWVTALTVASLLIGGGALNAFAEQGGKNGNGGRGNVQHQQQGQGNNEKSKSDNGNHGQGRVAPVVEVEAAFDKHDDDKHENKNLNRARRDDEEIDEDEDLVTEPDLVTGDVRPGKGCGDRNHEHLRHDECPDKFLDEDEMEGGDEE